MTHLLLPINNLTKHDYYEEICLWIEEFQKISCDSDMKHYTEDLIYKKFIYSISNNVFTHRLAEHVETVKERIRELVAEGLDARDGWFR